MSSTQWGLVISAPSRWYWIPHNSGAAWGWEQLTIRAPSGLSEVRLTHLSGPLGLLLEPLVGSPTSDLSVWLLGFLIAWWLGSKSPCHKRKEVEAASFLRPGPRKWHWVIFTIFCWSSCHRSQIQGKYIQTPTSLSLERVPKNLAAMFYTQHSCCEMWGYIVRTL